MQDKGELAGAVDFGGCAERGAQDKQMICQEAQDKQRINGASPGYSGFRGLAKGGARIRAGYRKRQSLCHRGRFLIVSFSAAFHDPGCILFVSCSYPMFILLLCILCMTCGG